MEMSTFITRALILPTNKLSHFNYDLFSVLPESIASLKSHLRHFLKIYESGWHSVFVLLPKYNEVLANSSY